MEYAVLRTLAEHPGWVIGRDEIARRVSDLEYYSNSISVHISHLRAKLRVSCAGARIETVRGLGYRLVAVEPGDSLGDILGDELPAGVKATEAGGVTGALEFAAGGGLASLLLVGGAGSGKTALLHRMKSGLHRNGWATSIVDCRVTEGVQALAPWRLMLSSLGAPVESLKFPSRKGRVLDLVGASLGVAATMSSMLMGRPMMAAFDCADHLDADSLRVLGHVAATLADGPLLLIVSGRDENGELTDLFGAHAAFEQRLTPVPPLSVVPMPEPAMRYPTDEESILAHPPIS